MEIYITETKRIQDLETNSAKLNARDRSDQLRSSYQRLLAKFPHLEGYWVRRAHMEFRLTETPAGAIEIFRTALSTLNLKYSLILWTEYLRFLLHVCHTAPEKPREIFREFDTASKLVGTHFLSHEFWDLYLEIHEKPVSLLLHIMDNCTLHQFSRYYAKLVSALEKNNGSLAPFNDLLPFEVQGASLTAEELPQIRAVILSKLKLKYELHLRRVNEVLPFEMAIKRPFFHPMHADATPWLEYLKHTDNELQIFRRALIPLALDPQMWLAYIRFCHSQGDSTLIDESYEVPVKLRSVPAMLHCALWSERCGDLDKAEAIYKLLESHTNDRVIELHFDYITRHQGIISGREYLENSAGRVCDKSILKIDKQGEELIPLAATAVAIPSIESITSGSL